LNDENEAPIQPDLFIHDCGMDFSAPSSHDLMTIQDDASNECIQFPVRRKRLQNASLSLHSVSLSSRFDICIN